MIEIWVDGGNTDEIPQQIDNSTPPEANDLRNDLMAESPYLSDTVLVNAIEKEAVLTDAMIRDVLVANPQSAKSSRIMDELNQRIYPLPDYMMAEVEQGLFTVSQREMLEAELAYHIQERMLARNNLIHSYNSDTIPSKYDSLIAFYHSENDRMLKYDLAFLYAEENDSINALNTLDSIPIEYDLNSLQQANHHDYTDYFNLFLSGVNNTIAGYEPDSLQISGLYLLANSSSIPV